MGEEAAGEEPRRVVDSLTPPKIEVGPFIRQIKVERGGFLIPVNIHRSPVVPGDKREESEKLAYMGVNQKGTEVIDLDLDDKALHEPSILSSMGYQEKYTLDTQLQLENTERERSARKRSSRRRR